MPTHLDPVLGFYFESSLFLGNSGRFCSTLLCCLETWLQTKTKTIIWEQKSSPGEETTLKPLNWPNSGTCCTVIVSSSNVSSVYGRTAESKEGSYFRLNQFSINTMTETNKCNIHSLIASRGPEKDLMACRKFFFNETKTDKRVSLTQRSDSCFLLILTSCGGPERTHSGTPMSFRVNIIPATQRRSLLPSSSSWIYGIDPARTWQAAHVRPAQSGQEDVVEPRGFHPAT